MINVVQIDRELAVIEKIWNREVSKHNALAGLQSVRDPRTGFANNVKLKLSVDVEFH